LLNGSAKRDTSTTTLVYQFQVMKVKLKNSSTLFTKILRVLDLVSLNHTLLDGIVQRPQWMPKHSRRKSKNQL
jgi:hypothetical protein